MKRFLALILVVLLAGLLLCGCGGEGETQAAPTAQSGGATQAPASEAVSAPAQTAGTEPRQTEAAPTEPPVMVDPSWFDDAVFIGDSVTVALDYYCASDYDILGDAQFVCGVSLGYHNALWELDSEYAVHPTYRGETVLAETAAEITGADKVFVMLGVNDIGTYGADDTMEAASELVDRILTRTPDVEIYMQSTTPMIDDQESGWLNNDKISDFNEQLKAYCEENGYHFIDIYHRICDEEGDLPEEYCSDVDVQGIHFNNEGCGIWADFLKASVADSNSH